MRITAITFAALCTIVSMPVLACSFAPGYEIFQFAVPNPNGIGPETPVLTGYEIKRGYNDGNFASCSDAGIIELYFERTHGVGYLFEPIGEFEDNLFPKEIDSLIKPVNFCNAYAGAGWDGLLKHGQQSRRPP